MDPDLVDEIEYMQELLTKSGFFSQDEMLEILEDQFIEEEIVAEYCIIHFNGPLLYCRIICGEKMISYFQSLVNMV